MTTNAKVFHNERCLVHYLDRLCIKKFLYSIIIIIEQLLHIMHKTLFASLAREILKIECIITCLQEFNVCMYYLLRFDESTKINFLKTEKKKKTILKNIKRYFRI